MTYDLNFVIQLDPAPALPEERLRQAIQWLLDRHVVEPESGLSIVIADDATVQEMNREFRSVDAPTDVLSFPSESDPTIPEEEAAYLGDLILSLPYIQRHADEEQHPVDDELVLAVIHGTLHLLGYDHDNPENQAEMWIIQSEALQVMQINIVVPHFRFDDSE